MSTACISQLKWIYFEQKGRRLVDLQIFNEASRGPFGALSLILHIRWGATIASLGALLMILALTQDTFYQAIYSTYTDLTSQASEVATLAKSNCFDSRTLEAGYSELAMSPMYSRLANYDKLTAVWMTSADFRQRY